MTLAVDFGTTNTVVARAEGGAAARLLALPGLSAPAGDHQPPLVPSLLYVHPGGALSAGQAVRDQGLDEQRDARLFRNFKRGILAGSAAGAEPRRLDGRAWTDRDAGRAFLHAVLAAARQSAGESAGESAAGGPAAGGLVVSAPVAAFESYLAWLHEALGDQGEGDVHVIDESTAAALGYAVTAPGAVVLVVDFGGGTLDLSLVQLPESRERTGGLLQRLRRGGAGRQTARVIAKAGRALGGSDVDHWLLAATLARCGLDPAALGRDYAALLTRCEQAKIALSSIPSVPLVFHAAGREQAVEWTRAELEALLEREGFYAALRRALDRVLHAAQRRGVFREDVAHVLLVGGTALMPSVQAVLAGYCERASVHADRPFSAVAEGALLLGAGLGLDDQLVHGYALRHVDPAGGRHRYDELIPMGSPCPLPAPVTLTLAAAHPGQRSVEFVVAEIDSDALAMVALRYDQDQAAFVAQAGEGAEAIVPLNAGQAEQALAPLDPPGTPGQPRLDASFTVDAARRLRVTVVDRLSGRVVLKDSIVAVLR